MPVKKMRRLKHHRVVKPHMIDEDGLNFHVDVEVFLGLPQGS